MYRVIKASISYPSLEEYVGLPFDLKNEEVQYKIAEYAEDKLIQTLKQTKGYKRRKFFIDDLNWSSSKIYFELIEEPKDGDYENCNRWDFSCRLNFFDGPSEDYNDVEYMIDEEIKEFIYQL